MRKFYTMGIAMMLTALLVAAAIPAQDEKPKGNNPAAKKDGDDKAKAEKKERADKLQKSFEGFTVGGKIVQINIAFFEYAVDYNVHTMGRRDYPVYAFVAYPKKSGLAGEAHCGQLTGYIGSRNGWAVFGARTGSGVALKVPSTVIFVPQGEDGTFGAPQLVAPEEMVGGFTPYLVDGDGTGQYWVKTR